MTAPMGWRITVNEDTNPRSLFNFPMQTSCAEILRVATTMMLDNGIQLCALVHDAVLIEAPLDRIGHDVAIAQQCWREASQIVLDGFALESDCVVNELSKPSQLSSQKRSCRGLTNSSPRKQHDVSTHHQTVS